MPEEKTPFTDYATRANRPMDSNRWGWIVAGIFALLFIVAILLWVTAASKARGLGVLRTKLDEANANWSNALAENQTNKDLIAGLQSKITQMQQEQDAATQMSHALENEMRAGLESKDVTISNLQGRLTVNILDRVMFDSGEATLKPDGAAVMRKVAAIFVEHPELKIQVVGHTDNVPIRPDARSKFASNWELSTARALAAVHFLTEIGGVNPRRIGAVGYGEFRPIADNSTAEGRARNRRIEIIVLPDEETNTVTRIKSDVSNPPRPPVEEAPPVAPMP